MVGKKTGVKEMKNKAVLAQKSKRVVHPLPRCVSKCREKALFLPFWGGKKPVSDGRFPYSVSRHPYCVG